MGRRGTAVETNDTRAHLHGVLCDGIKNVLLLNLLGVLASKRLGWAARKHRMVSEAEASGWRENGRSPRRQVTCKRSAEVIWWWRRRRATGSRELLEQR